MSETFLELPEDCYSPPRSAERRMVLDEYGQPVCPQCGERTNRHYRNHGDKLSCWSCSQPLAVSVEFIEKVKAEKAKQT